MRDTSIETTVKMAALDVDIEQLSQDLLEAREVLEHQEPPSFGVTLRLFGWAARLHGEMCDEHTRLGWAQMLQERVTEE